MSWTCRWTASRLIYVRSLLFSFEKIQIWLCERSTVTRWRPFRMFLEAGQDFPSSTVFGFLLFTPWLYQLIKACHTYHLVTRLRKVRVLLQKVKKVRQNKTNNCYMRSVRSYIGNIQLQTLRRIRGGECKKRSKSNMFMNATGRRCDMLVRKHCEVDFAPYGTFD